MSLSSYKDETSSGAVRIELDHRKPIEGKHILIVEDIIDTGKTLQYLQAQISAKLPASLEYCVFCIKKASIPNCQIKAKYLGFECPDEWVVGYGLDYAEQYRTLPYVGILKEEIYKK